MIYFGTGHRPEKLGGYSEEARENLVSYLIDVLTLPQPNVPSYDLTKGISGMALGFDQAFAVALTRLNRPWIAAIPFKGQEKMWPKESQDFYHELLTHASEIVVVSEGGYHPAKMQIRNSWMVDHGDAGLALWDGSKGGTCNCVKYADKVSKEVFNLWPGWESRIAI